MQFLALLPTIVAVAVVFGAVYVVRSGRYVHPLAAAALGRAVGAAVLLLTALTPILDVRLWPAVVLVWLAAALVLWFWIRTC